MATTTNPQTQKANPAILAQHVYASGAVGITRGQTARWHVVNPRSPVPHTGPTCPITLSFINAQGRVLRTSSVTLKPGESGLLELKVDDLLPDGTGGPIHAEATVPATGPVDEPGSRINCAILPTLEIVDNASGRTSVLLEGSLVRPAVSILRDDTPAS
jgi:hypothetical protein